MKISVKLLKIWHHFCSRSSRSWVLASNKERKKSLNKLVFHPKIMPNEFKPHTVIFEKLDQFSY